MGGSLSCLRSVLGTVRDQPQRRLARAAVLAAAGLALAACGSTGASSAQPIARGDSSTGGLAGGLGAPGSSSGVASSGDASNDAPSGADAVTGAGAETDDSHPSATVEASRGTAGSATGDTVARATTAPHAAASTSAGTTATASTEASTVDVPAGATGGSATTGTSAAPLRVTATPQRVVAVAGQPLRVRVGWSDGSGTLAGTTEDWGDAGTSSKRLIRCDGTPSAASDDSYVLEHRFPRPGSYSFRYEVTTVSCHGSVATTERAQVKVPITVLPRDTARR